MPDSNIMINVVSAKALTFPNAFGVFLKLQVCKDLFTGDEDEHIRRDTYKSCLDQNGFNYLDGESPVYNRISISLPLMMCRGNEYMTPFCLIIIQDLDPPCFCSGS